MVRRHAILALVAFIAGAGCHAGNSGGLAKQEPALTKETLSKTRIIAQHNKNAAAITSLRASPSIVVAADGRSGKLNGQLAMVRPKDFRLDISSMMHKQADIGSNDKGFWFWVKDNSDKAIYVCDYDHVNASPLAVTMQPEWIIEAMGLREISDREAATISAKPGDKPGQVVLTQFRKDAKGDTLTKVTVVDESTGEIREHRLYAGAERELLARATISEHQRVTLKPTNDNPSGADVDLPSKFRLEWIVEKFSLDITMNETRVNPQFPKEQRTALFTEPPIPGAVRKDLALLGGAPAASSSRIYESMPRSSVRLGQPEAVPMDVDGALRSTGQPLSANLANTQAQPTGVVGAPIPSGADPDAVRASSWRNRQLPIFEQ
jgi:hypothetical protein